MSGCWKIVVSSSRRTRRSSRSRVSRKTGTCSTPSSPCMKSHRRTTTGNSQKQTLPPCSRKPRQRLKSWVLRSSRQTMGRAHERPVFAPVCRCVRPFGAGWSPSPNEGVKGGFAPFWPSLRGRKKKRDKTLAPLLALWVVTSARSAGSLRGFYRSIQVPPFWRLFQGICSRLASAIPKPPMVAGFSAAPNMTSYRLEGKV